MKPRAEKHSPRGISTAPGPGEETILVFCKNN